MVKFGFIALGTILIASAAVSGATLKHVMTNNSADDELITGSINGADRSGYYIDVYKLNHALNKD